MDRTLQVLAVLVLLAAIWLKWGNVGTTPEVLALRNTGLTTADAKLIASYVRVYGNLIVEDGGRDSPYVMTLDDLKRRLRDMGNLTIGTQWKVGERYPDLPPILAGFFQLETMDREAFHSQADHLADILEKV